MSNERISASAPDRFAFPSEHDGHPSCQGMPHGLTKRELFAAMAMQGSLGGTPGSHLIPPNLAKLSVDYADALLAALDQVTP